MVTGVLAVIPLTWIAWVDGRTRRIPFVGILLLLLCGLIQISLGLLSITNAVIGLFALGILVWILATLIDHGRAIGGRDVWLCAAIGFLLGPINGGLTIYLAVILLALCGLIFGRKALPFAPFVLPAYCIILLLRSVCYV
jgi:hypothetical protein